MVASSVDFALTRAAAGRISHGAPVSSRPAVRQVHRRSHRDCSPAAQRSRRGGAADDSSLPSSQRMRLALLQRPADASRQQEDRKRHHPHADAPEVDQADVRDVRRKNTRSAAPIANTMNTQLRNPAASAVWVGRSQGRTEIVPGPIPGEAALERRPRKHDRKHDQRKECATPAHDHHQGSDETTERLGGDARLSFAGGSG